MGYERADLTMFFYESLYAEPFARYTPVVAATPEGSEIVDDWEIFWGLAKRLNLQLVYDGVPQIGRAHVCTPVTNAHLVCRLLLEKKKITKYSIRKTMNVLKH